MVLPMPTALTITSQALVDAAMATIETLPVARAIALYETEEAVFVDIRDVRELMREGGIPGAVHAPRGFLEFWIDPESQYHRDVFCQDKLYVFFCAGALRSALAVKAVQDMGFGPVAHIGGGFSAWRDAGGVVAPYAENATTQRRSQ